MKILFILVIISFGSIFAHDGEIHELSKTVVEPNWFLIHLHPKLVHLPLGLLFGAIIMETLHFIFRKEKFRVASFISFSIGLLTAGLALSSGFLADNMLGHGYKGHDQAHEHRNLMIFGSSIWLLVWLCFQYSKLIREQIRVAVLLGMLVVGITFTYGAHEGGELVYNYGVGVKAVMMKGNSQAPKKAVEKREHHHE